MRWTASLAVLLGVAACSSATTWTKDGVAPDVAAQDIAECRSSAREALHRDANIQADIMASRGLDWQKSGAMDTKRTNFQAETHEQESDVVERCMISKGYAPGGI